MADPSAGCVELPGKPTRKLRLVRADPLNPQMVFVEARRQARKATVEAIKRQGRRAEGVPIAELQRLALAYLEAHRDQLIAEARSRLAERR
jgi:hypothetical protein